MLKDEQFERCPQCRDSSGRFPVAPPLRSSPSTNDGSSNNDSLPHQLSVTLRLAVDSFDTVANDHKNDRRYNASKDVFEPASIRLSAY